MNGRPSRADDFEARLRRHAVAAWFPRSLDSEYGGFLCDFDRAWKTCGPHEKLLEFQARQTLFAAEALQVYPDDDRLAEAVRHGFAFLRSVMWDDRTGGWFHRLDRGGHPLEGHTKHAHGVAYAIQACVAVYRASHDDAALAHAREAFAWLDDHAHDRENAGFFGFLDRTGEVIRDGSQVPWAGHADTIGTPIGLKDLNVQSDLVEALFHLHEATADPNVAQRLNELVSLICNRAFDRSGALSYYLFPDLEPVPHPPRFGTELQTAYRLVLCAPVVANGEHLRAVARRLVDHALESGLDHRSGGFFTIGADTQGRAQRTKQWWVQAEALKALLAVGRDAGDGSHYLARFEDQYRYLRRNFIDGKHGGMYWLGIETLPAARRAIGATLARSEFTRKGGDWKDASHDGRAWLHCLRAFTDADDYSPVDALHAGRSAGELSRP
jgi:mannobiose 2-epimerase